MGIVGLMKDSKSLTTPRLEPTNQKSALKSCSRQHYLPAAMGFVHFGLLEKLHSKLERPLQNIVYKRQKVTFVIHGFQYIFCYECEQVKCLHSNTMSLNRFQQQTQSRPWQLLILKLSLADVKPYGAIKRHPNIQHDPSVKSCYLVHFRQLVAPQLSWSYKFPKTSESAFVCSKTRETKKPPSSNLPKKNVNVL